MAPITTSRLLFRAASLAFGLALMLTPLTSSTQLSNSESAYGSLSGQRSQVRARAEAVELPLSFEANRGQADPRVRFVSRGNGYSLLLTPNEAVIRLRAGIAAPEQERATLRMKLIGANPYPRVEGDELLPGKSSYFMGSAESAWIRDIPNYAKVRYRGVYTGVDLTFYGNQRQLEYDFIVSAGSDPGLIRLSFEGATSLTLDAREDLVIDTPAGGLVMRKPLIYQEADGSRKNVEGRYSISDGGSVGFQIGDYDQSLPLVIDPVLGYSTYLGGRTSDIANDIAIDSGGNAYITGETDSLDFPMNPDTSTEVFQRRFSASSDAFVVKLDPSGRTILFSTYLGKKGFDRALSIAVDQEGNSYITGRTDSPNFPVTDDAGQKSLAGSDDAFLVKLDSAGRNLLYSTYAGGEDLDIGTSVALDSADNVFITGFTLSTKFPTTAGAFQTSLKGRVDAFLARFSPSPTGQALSLGYSTFIGGGDADEAYGLAVDPAGIAYITGLTRSRDYPTTAGAFQTLLNGSSDAFLTRFDTTSAGSGSLLFSTFLGGSLDDQGRSISLDEIGNPYVTGQTASKDFPTTAGAAQPFLRGSLDAFVTKLNPGGAQTLYSTYLGGGNNDVGTAIGIEGVGNAYVTGHTDSADYPTTEGALQTAFGGGSVDAFVTKLAATGSSPLVYSTYFGGSNLDEGRGLAVDKAGNVFVAGLTMSNNLLTSPGVPRPGFGGYCEGFVLMLTEPADLSIQKTASPNPVFTGSEVTYQITVTNNGPVAASSVVVTDSLPAGTSFISCSASDGVACSAVANNITKTFASIASGASATLTIVARVSCAVRAGTTLSNTAALGTNAPAILLANNSATATVEVRSRGPFAVLDKDRLTFSEVDPDRTVRDDAESQNFTIKNEGCDELVLKLNSVARQNFSCSPCQVKSVCLNDKKLFRIQPPESLTVAPEGGEAIFKVFFQPVIPDVVCPNTDLLASDVLPETIQSKVSIFQNGGSPLTVDLEGRVTSSFKLFKLAESIPPVRFVRDGDQFIVSITLFDSRLDIGMPTYTFFRRDGSEVPLRRPDPVEDVPAGSVISGQSFTLKQRFSNAKDHPDTARVVVVIKDGERTLTIGTDLQQTATPDCNKQRTRSCVKN